MYQKILVPLDGSSSAEIALPYAEEIAARIGSEIILAKVFESAAAEIILVKVFESSPSDMDRLYRSYLEHVTERVRQEMKDWQPGKEANVHFEVLLGKPATEILRCADKRNMDLIVMASRGSSGEGSWLLGNIAAKILQAAQCPILLIRAPAEVEALRQKRLVKRVLVPLDGSDLGEAAVPCAEALARTLDAEIVLFQVIEPPVTTRPVPQLGMTREALQEYEEQTKPLSLAYLDSVAGPLGDGGIKISTAAGFGYPADQIIDYTRANAIDIIAMSTHGRSGIRRWVFGSVTDKVLHAGDTPVLVVRAAKA
ncbi:MAG: universal stress protein [Chloroflexota bacterium]